jgi:DNA invertase Pin-like site-specific DNA recombinase
VELLGRYSNHDIMTHLRQVLADQKPGSPPGRTTRSPHKKQAQRRLDVEEVDRLLQHYRAGDRINDLAAEFGISRTTVMKHVERAGAPRRRNIIRDHLEDARRLYESGWSLARVGRHFGVDPATVGYAFRKASIPRRDTHGR